jgi:predicted nucleic acid binding AN1-type Zn finger protein
MYDHKIGIHCADPTCRQKDYLPIKCKYCSTVYCADHYSIGSHNCQEYSKQMKQVFSCPLCNKIISVNQNLSI